MHRSTDLAPLGLIQHHHSSNHVVPSQLNLENASEVEIDLNNDIIDDIIDPSDEDRSDDSDFPSIAMGIQTNDNLHINFLPMYQTCTKLAETLGINGREILKQGMRKIRADLLSEHISRDARTENVQTLSLPVSTHSRSNKRKSKITSPSKN